MLENNLSLHLSLSLSLFGEAKLLNVWSVDLGMWGCKNYDKEMDGLITCLFHTKHVLHKKIKNVPIFAVVAKWFAPSHFIRPLECHERTNWEHTLPVTVILFTYKVYGVFLCNGFSHLFQNNNNMYIYIYVYSSYCLVLIFSDSIQPWVSTHILLYFLQWSAQYPPCKS